jgi:GMP synthase (glutamine-hydrolysing)
MKTAIVIRHVLFEDLGLLAPLLQEHDFAIRYLEAGLDDLSPAGQADLLIVLGGPIGAFDEEKYPFILDELAVIKHRLSLQQATLGICLGAQLMARALGAAVSPMQQQEIGFSPLTLTAAGEKSPLLALQNQPVLHWHGDQFAIPQAATLLAASAQCPHQAFSLGDYALALQFHAEADYQRIEQWLIGHVAELTMAGIEPCQLRKQAADSGAALSSACRSLFTQWLNQLPNNATILNR